ncbi:hypothetical protein E2A64_08400 [Pseudohoeflea suaedae]|uniref:Uncharacterized protein n=1 Tax=Pseudohoeflea suaedae TaxID=877384 RepID=A0A4R5PPY3_9HYPH|nr:hypothetical protein [Pseudohoeflea suaedae]TDH39089.1 hypothetical protein E2A64_08400 [Pseudohoeflea suaedae]
MEISAWVFSLIGGVFFAVGFFFVMRNLAITTGHALIFALGAALIALPHVKDFEWSDGKFKYTAKQTTLDLSQELKSVTEQQKSLAQQIATLATALERNSDQLNELQLSVSKVSPSIAPPAPASGTFSRTMWENLKAASEEIEGKAGLSLQQLEKIQGDIISAE